MKKSKLIQHVAVIMQVSVLALNTGQAQTQPATSSTGLVTAAQAQASRMKTVTNSQRKAAAAQARAQRSALRAATKAAAKTRLSQPANSSSVTAAANAALSASPNAAVIANTTTAAPTASTSNTTSSGVISRPLIMAATPMMAAMTTTTATPVAIVPGQITDKAGNPILNGTTPTGIPGSTVAAPNVCQPGILDYFNCGNYANSPLPEPTLDVTDPANPKIAVDANGNMIPIPGTGIRKFKDTLAGVGAGNANNLGNYIPIATPGRATLSDGTADTKADYYEIELKRYKQQLHTDLPSTVLQGYHDASANAKDGSFHYLGPIIFAQRDVPVRVKFTNSLPTGTNGNMFLPIDKTMKGAGTGPDGKTYGENRALLHLHGGITPWISDGTPHQWITPAGDPTTLKKGASQQNVPDMAQPAADGSSGWDTWYYTNQQSARMLWYHDHSYATTRHNVYAGEAAPYLITDKWEQDLINGTNVTGSNPSNLKLLPDQSGLDRSGQGAYKLGIPLVIQDKTFVPPTVDKAGKLPAPYTMDQLMAEDPTWFSSKDNTGTHSVISTVDGTNDSVLGQFGQLWFPHVFMPNQNPNDPNTVVNGYGRWDYGAWVWPPVTGLKYPPISVNDPVTGSPVTIPPFPNPSAVQEAFMDTPVVNGTAYPKMTVGKKAYRFRILNAANDRHWNLQFYYATDANGNVCKPATDPTVCTEVKMIPSSPVKGMPQTWPTDGRDGGVPDWTTAGPDIIQIGSDSGFLPAPVAIPSQPINYEYNRRVITALNVSDHALLLGPAERADVVVDFSNVPDGAVLILYNDAPAPDPGFDARLDYYTGDPDQSDSGGAPTTLPGYGPNTRTVMQFVVDSTIDPGTGTFDAAQFATAMKTVYPAEQKAPLVPAQAYGNNSNIYAKIQDVTYDMTQGKFVDSSVNTGTDTAITMKPKSIAEEFDTDWGRMTAQLGVELPFSNFLTQTTLQMWMFDPPTEIATAHDEQNGVLNPGDVQIWRVTHNGVDTHSIHFHMFDVQLINRVAWDGTMYPPDANEMGWKETVRMNPLTDAIIALRPIKPTLPFSLTDSFRPLDPTSPLDTAGPSATTPAFTNVDPITNNPLTISNQLVNFGWEYVWHCHLLGHEENDMMRPIVVKVEPETPVVGAVTRNNDFSAHITWTNTAASATGFDIQRATDAAFTQGVTTFHIAPSVTTTSQMKPGTTASYDDTSASAVVPYFYRVAATKLFNNPVMETTATNILASAWSNAAQAPTSNLPNATVNPNALTFAIMPIRGSSAGQVVTVGNTGTANLTVSSITAAGDYAQVNNCSTVAPNASCSVTVTFKPTVAGTRTGSLTINTNDPLHSHLTVSLSGLGTAVVVNPKSLIYGTGAATQQFTVQNLGATTLTGLAFTKAGINAADFTVSTLPQLLGGCGTTLAAGRTCTMSVRFAGATTVRNGTVSVGSSDPAGAQLVTLTGGVAPAITLTPNALAFGNSNLNSASTALTVTVTSSGNWPVGLSGVTLTGTNANQFAQTNNCPITLAVGSTCTVSVTFTPTTTGAKTGTLNVNANAPASGKTVSLSGTGISSSPVISVAPTTSSASPYNFGTRTRNSNTNNVFTITNSGQSATTINSVAVGAGSSTAFTILAGTGTTCTTGKVLNANQTCTITVQFHAPVFSTVNGTVVVTPASPATAQTIYMRGTGF